MSNYNVIIIEKSNKWKISFLEFPLIDISNQKIVKINMNYLRKIKHILNLLISFFSGFIKFNSTGETPKTAFQAMRQLFIMTNGRFNDAMTLYFNYSTPKYSELKPDGVLGKLSQNEVRNIVDNIQQNGYYVSPKKLDPNIITKIVEFAKKTPAPTLLVSGEANHQLKFPVQFSSEKSIFDIKNPVSPIYKYDPQQLLESQDIEDLVTDQSFLAIAQEYFGCRPILDNVNMWWSAPFDKKGTSEAAQMYHFDLDRIKFLKFFIYLTDVDSDNGPHCYVKGTHKRKARALLSEGRRTHEEMAKWYSKSDMVELCGEKGTIIISDTIGFHKGKPLVKGHRLIFEVIFAISKFGANYPKIKLGNNIGTKMSYYLEKYPDTYANKFENHRLSS